MPTTEAGKRLLADVTACLGAESYVGYHVTPAAIDAIEAEAVAAERARIRAAVEGLNPQQDGDIVTLNGTHRRPVTPADYVELSRAAVLTIIDREDTDATD